MCKLFAIVEVENQHNAEMFAKKAIPYVTETDNDGLGIMRLGENGVFIKRWLEPPTVIRQKKSKHLLKYSKALKHQENEEGKVSNHLYALAIHGRFATCEKSMANTHPFFKKGVALMHNGIITNADKFDRTLSTCDSEALLTQYLGKFVDKNPLNLTSALEDINGYYAAIVFNNNGTIDIWRDGTATLFMAHIKHVGIVLATTQEIIMKTARKCKAYVSGIDEILPYTMIRWRNGVSPQISTFTKRLYVPEVLDKSLLDHQNSVSDASSFDKDFLDVERNDHWWDIENAKDREAARIADWNASEEMAEKEALQRLYDEKRGR